MPMSSLTQRMAADHGLVPFLKIDARPAGELSGLQPHTLDMPLELERVPLGTPDGADQRSEAAHVARGFRPPSDDC